MFSVLSTYLKTRCNNGNLSITGTAAQLLFPVSEKQKKTNRKYRKFSFEEEFFIVLVKLKTGNVNKDLAQTFDTSAGHISILFGRRFDPPVRQHSFMETGHEIISTGILPLLLI